MRYWGIRIVYCMCFGKIEIKINIAFVSESESDIHLLISATVHDCLYTATNSRHCSSFHTWKWDVTSRVSCSRPDILPARTSIRPSAVFWGAEISVSLFLTINCPASAVVRNPRWPTLTKSAHGWKLRILTGNGCSKRRSHNPYILQTSSIAMLSFFRKKVHGTRFLLKMSLDILLHINFRWLQSFMVFPHPDPLNGHKS